CSLVYRYTPVFSDQEPTFPPPTAAHCQPISCALLFIVKNESSKNENKGILFLNKVFFISFNCLLGFKNKKNLVKSVLLTRFYKKLFLYQLLLHHGGAVCMQGNDIGSCRPAGNIECQGSFRFC